VNSLGRHSEDTNLRNVLIMTLVMCVTCMSLCKLRCDLLLPALLTCPHRDHYGNKPLGVTVSSLDYTLRTTQCAGPIQYQNDQIKSINQSTPHHIPCYLAQGAPRCSCVSGRGVGGQGGRVVHPPVVLQGGDAGLVEVHDRVETPVGPGLLRQRDVHLPAERAGETACETAVLSGGVG
jgi:hypothetical protein